MIVVYILLKKALWKFILIRLVKVGIIRRKLKNLNKEIVLDKLAFLQETQENLVFVL